jgi:hypothetical protein
MAKSETTAADLLKLEKRIRKKESEIALVKETLKEKKKELESVYHELRNYICDTNQMDLPFPDDPDSAGE